MASRGSTWPCPILALAPSFAGNYIGGATVIPALNVNGYWSGGENNGLNPNFGDIYEWTGNVSKIIGSHTLKFGGSWASSNFESLYNNANSTYSTAQTGNPQNSAEPGSALASYLLNVPDNAGRRNVHETTRYGGVLGFYFQDQWKATSKLTVNMGIRYDLTIQPPYGKWDTVGSERRHRDRLDQLQQRHVHRSGGAAGLQGRRFGALHSGRRHVARKRRSVAGQQDLPQHDQQLGPPPRLRVPAWRQDGYPFGLRDHLRQLGRSHSIGAELRRRLA